MSSRSPEQRSLRDSGEALLPEERLRRRADFLRCYQRGRRYYGQWVTLHVVDRGPGAAGPRLGITVTRKVGGAVVRHRIKRRIKEIYRRWNQRRQLPPFDILVHVKPRAREVDFNGLQTELIRLLTPLIRSANPIG